MKAKARNNALFWFVLFLSNLVWKCFASFPYAWQWFIFIPVTLFYAALAGLYLCRYERARKQEQS